ncbi:ATP-binding protein [Hymenobacter algoricola]|uniref:histidine kinase n=1 Tax=Hymenobacter algoricola TaxID=486267 RepID=A0ABP7N3T9_9BACT
MKAPPPVPQRRNTDRLVACSNSNAPAARKIVRASLSADRQHALVSVQDHGPGIAPQYQEKIFRRFVQIPDKNSYRGGSGLGLGVAREFIGSQGGQLWVGSELGAGSACLFTRPLAVPGPA